MTPQIFAIEVRDELFAIIREPVAVFFTVAMPVAFYLLFATLFGGDMAAGGPVSTATAMLATYGAFGVISVALFNPGVGVAEDRERGWLRVKRVSPVPIGTTLAAKVAASLPIAIGVHATMSLAAVAIGEFDMGLAMWVQIAGVLLLGSLPFALLGLAIGFTFSGRAAPAVVNAIFLPLAIAGGLWFPIEMLPPFVGRIAPVLPTYHVSQLALGVLYGDAVGDHVLALVATTAVTALLAGFAYRSGRR